MYRLPEQKVKRSIAWKQLRPHCSNEACTSRSGWASVIHHPSGIRLNEDWFCSPECMEEALEVILHGSYTQELRPAPIRTTMPLGLMMLGRGFISDLQLRAALDLQHDTGDQIGNCLIRLGCSISPSDIASVVATQWGCPVFPAESVQSACSMLLPASLEERYRMLPVHLVAAGRRLFVGFCDKVNHSALISVEQMLHCKTEACIIPDSKFEQVLDFRKADLSGEVAVTRPKSVGEACRMICNYVQQTGSDAVRLQAVEGNIWTRLLFRSSHLDLVFEHPPA
jgi:hypothetical protein